MSIEETVAKQGLFAAMGATIGAVTKHAIKPSPGSKVPMAAQVASAMGAAAAGGAGLGGSVAAGTAIVTAKVAVVTAAATAAAPVVIGGALVGGAGFGLYKLFSSKK